MKNKLYLILCFLFGSILFLNLNISIKTNDVQELTLTSLSTSQSLAYADACVWGEGSGIWGLSTTQITNCYNCIPPPGGANYSTDCVPCDCPQSCTDCICCDGSG